jgi:hypothetical protein
VLHEYFRATRVPLLAVWGRGDQIFGPRAKDLWAATRRWIRPTSAELFRKSTLGSTGRRSATSYLCSLSEMARCAEQARGIVNHHTRCSSRADVTSGKGRRCSALGAARRN